jgi:O-antigen/teichoic acid export membrane protein
VVFDPIDARRPVPEPAPATLDGRSSGPLVTGPSRIARNVVTSYGLRGLRAVSALLLTPYLFRSLGVDGFGTWSILFTVATVFGLVEVSATLGVTKHVAERAAPGDASALRELVGTAAGMMTGLGALALAVSIPLALAADGLAAAGLEGEFAAGMIMLGAVQLVRCPSQAYGAALMGLQRYDLFNAGDAVTALSFLAGAVAAVELGAGITGLAAAYAGSLLLGAATWVVLLARLRRDALAPPRLGRSASRAAVVAFGWRSLLIDGMDFVAMRMDTIVVAALRSARAAAPLAAATRLVGGVQSLILPFVAVLVPMVAESDAAGRREAVRRQLLVATRVAAQVTLLAAGGLALFATDVVDVWLGSEAPPVTDNIVVILMLVQILILVPLPAGRVLLGLGRLNAITALAFLEGVGNLALSIVLVIEHGAIGAAVATLITSGLLVPLRIPLACRATGCSAQRLAREAFAPALAGCAPAFAVMIVAWLVLDPGLLRLAVGLGGGWAAGLLIAAAQIGPSRLRTALRRPAAPPSAVELSA